MKIFRELGSLVKPAATGARPSVGAATTCHGIQFRRLGRDDSEVILPIPNAYKDPAQGTVHPLAQLLASPHRLST